MLVVGCLAHVSHPRQRYRVPNILLTATSLTSLTLSYCLLPLSLMVDVVKFKCLKLLCLEWITLNEDAIKRLTTSCPLLEELIVKSCYGFKRLCVYGLLNLQQVSFCFGPEVERIEIDAPNLCYLCLNDFYETGAPPSINLASCKKLTRVCYQGKGLADLSSNFPFLEDLFLVLPDECERLNVSSHSLRTFMLHSKCELDKINVDAPNLLLFGFTDHLRFYSPKETILVPSKACIEWDCTDDHSINDHWFQKLRQFLDKKIRFKELKLHICVDPIVSIKSEVIQWPPIEFDHVELEAEWFEYKSMYELVVDSLLWCCRPQSLTLIIDFSLLKFEEWESVVKHTHKKLLEQEDQAHTNIQFVMSSSSSKDKMNFSDLSTLLKALPRDESKQRITFIKYRSCSRSRKRKPSKVSESNRDDGIRPFRWWKFQALAKETLVESCECLKFENDDFIRRGHILNAMLDPLLDVYQNYPTTRELWKALEEQFFTEDATRRLSRHTSSPGKEHWDVVNRVFRYLKKTMDYGLEYSGDPSVLEGYTDASWITDQEDYGGIVSIESEVIQWLPIELDHIELEAEWFKYKDMYKLVADSLLWCCRPQSLTLIIDFSLLDFEE
ncbi:F-box domain containing protein [Tanacetum coccineum]|uniref:F-box domain containing protein n=1 Tax=Tanacetum coccineum TaxID=301880 RepID=A0ABQ5F6I2_9ASTR